MEGEAGQFLYAAILTLLSEKKDYEQYDWSFITNYDYAQDMAYC